MTHGLSSDYVSEHSSSGHPQSQNVHGEQPVDPIDDNSLLDSVDELDFGNIRLDFLPSEQAVETSNDVSDISSALHRIQHLQKQFSFYKKTTTLLLRVCESFVFTVYFGPKERMFSNGEGFDVQRWFKKIVGILENWTSRTPLDSLLEWKAMRSDLEQIVNSQPDPIREHWLQKIKGMKKEEKYACELKIFYESHEVSGEDLYGMLGDRIHLKEVMTLNSETAKSFADLLYELMRLDSDSTLNRRYERILRRLCGKAGVLPTSFYIPHEELEKTSSQAVAGGGFADVYEGRYKGEKVALKVLRVYNRENLRKTQVSFCKEAIFWKDLDHPNIVPFYGIANTNMFPLCMVSAWMEHGNLLSFLSRFPRANRIDLASDIVDGLHYLHKIGILHGDMKSGNVLINNSCRACLADFGLASLASIENSTAKSFTEDSSTHGSIRWMAPELLLPTDNFPSRISVATDVYSLAMTLYETFTGNIPFFDYPRDALVVFQVIQGLYPPLPRPGPEVTLRGLNDEVWKIMVACWNKDPTKRPRLGPIHECIENIRLNYEPPTISSPEECDEVEEIVFPSFRVIDYDSDLDDSDDWNTRRDLTKDPDPTYETIRIFGRAKTKASD